jgi:hypothetical protein
MSTYYVRKDGNDATGDGSAGAPWLTLDKALATISAGGGHLVLMGDGTYIENSSTLGYLHMNRKYTNLVTVRPEGESLGDVTVKGESSSVYSWRFNASEKLRFEYLKIGANLALQKTISFTGNNVQNIEFYHCPITILSRAGLTTYGFHTEPTDNQSHHDILIEGCPISQVGTDLVRGAHFSTVAGTNNSLVDITIRNCAINVTTYPIYLHGVTDFAVNGGSYWSSDAAAAALFVDLASGLLVDGGSFIASGAAAYGIIMGVNGVSGSPVGGVVQNAEVQSLTGHALLIGAGCSQVQALHNLVRGGDQGLVIKQSDQVIARWNNIQRASNNALYCKGATNVTLEYNSIFNNHGTLFRVWADDTGNGDKCQNITFRYNRLFGFGTSHLISWGDDTHDAGGGVCNYNVYSPHGSSGIGDIRGSNVASLAAMRAAWAGYGDSSNDGRSRILQDELPLWSNTTRHHHPGSVR